MRQTFNAMKTAGCIGMAAMITLLACKKDNDKNDSDESTAISLMGSATASQSLYDDAFDVVLQEGEENNVGGRVASCAVVTVTPGGDTYPKTMTIDFGTGCTSITGITRKGKITATLSNRIRTGGTSIAVAFDGYYVNNYKLEGAYSITNNSGNGNGLNFTTQVTAGKVTYPNGNWYSYSGTHTLSQTGGIGTLSFLDDEFSITGNCSIANSAGSSLNGAITTPLVKKMVCGNLVAGVDEFTYNGIKGTLNFGEGSCDNLATLTVGSKTQVVILPR